MVELKELHEEIASLLKKDFGLEELHFEMEDEVVDKELSFKLNPNCNGKIIKERLNRHFGPNLTFHACEISGILGILIENPN